MYRMNGTEVTPNIGYNRKLEGILPMKYLLLVYAVRNKINFWGHKETQELSPSITDRFRRWVA